VIVCTESRECTVADAGVFVEVMSTTTTDADLSVVLRVKYPAPTRTADTGMVGAMEYRALLRRGANGRYAVVGVTRGRVS
jgi:hypothetical protein